MNRTLKMIYGVGALVLGIFLSVSLISRLVSHDTSSPKPVEQANHFPDYIEQMNTYYDDFNNRKDHFHGVAERYMLPMEAQENCLTCHSLWPHQKNKKTRAFNNQHSRYMTCMVCHIGKKPGRPVSPEWYNFGIDNSITRQGPYGVTRLTVNELSGADNFISRILPAIIDGNIRTRLFTRYDTPTYIEYREAVIAGEPVDSSKVRNEAMALVGEKATSCSGCHSESSEFPWTDLGFGGDRLDEMLHSAVVGMVEKYESFYFPPVFE